MLTIAVVLLAAVLALLAAILRKLKELPWTVWSLNRKQRPDDDAKAMAALHEAATVKAAQLVAGIRGYHDQLAAELRRQTIDSHARAQTTDRRASDAAVALDAASALVRELRALLDRLAPAPEHERVTVEISPDPRAIETTRNAGGAASRVRPAVEPADEDRASDEEMTRVGPRPPAEALGNEKTKPSRVLVTPPGKKEGAP